MKHSIKKSFRLEQQEMKDRTLYILMGVALLIQTVGASFYKI